MWKTVIYATGNGLAPNNHPTATSVEPLHGTSDVIVGVGSLGLARVDSTGAQIWSTAALANFRNWDVDGSGNIIYTTGSGVLKAIDPTGTTTLWTRTLPSNISSVRCGQSNVFFERGSGVGQVNNASSTTGVDTWVSSASGFVGPLLAVDSNGDFTELGNVSGLGTALRKRSGATGNVIATGTTTPTSQRFGPGGYSTLNFSSISATGPGNTSIVPAWTATSVGGGSLTAKGAFGDSASLQGAGYGVFNYFWCTSGVITGSGGTFFSIFSTDSSGTLLWSQPSTQWRALCISDDGYLYVCGDWSSS